MAVFNDQACAELLSLMENASELSYRTGRSEACVARRFGI